MLLYSFPNEEGNEEVRLARQDKVSFAAEPHPLLPEPGQPPRPPGGGAPPLKHHGLTINDQLRRARRTCEFRIVPCPPQPRKPADKRPADGVISMALYPMSGQLVAAGDAFGNLGKCFIQYL